MASYNSLSKNCCRGETQHGHIFLFWNEFEIGLQPEDKGKSPSKKSTTPKSGKRKRRAISPVIVDQPSPSSKTNPAKRNLDFSGKGKEVPRQSENILNLPYSDSKEEREEEVDLTEQVAAENEEFPSPTPREGQDEQTTETSSSKPRFQRAKQLLEKIHELEILDREIKRNNARLTKINKELHN